MSQYKGYTAQCVLLKFLIDQTGTELSAFN